MHDAYIAALTPPPGGDTVRWRRASERPIDEARRSTGRRSDLDA
jgi:hypothetical protein